MKAIILAGGEGTRLQPLTILRPKPMIPLFDRPLLEHIVLLLKRNGFTEICITLRYLSSIIQNWFGNGEELGVWIEYRIETEPRGTAGSVRDCADFIDGEDFLVISGDAACSFDLRGFFEKHHRGGADATILTHKCSAPEEYGLVLTDSDGVVSSFLEKPQQENIVSDCINTGIYALSARVLSDIPETGTCDFGNELFPSLLLNGRKINTWQPDGYWNDIGTPQAYLQTCRDVLDGVFPLPVQGEIQRNNGLAYWISPEAMLENGVECGHYSVIGAGSHVSSGCKIRESVLNGAVLEQNVEVYGSILSENSHIGTGSKLETGSVISDGVIIGSGSVVREGVCIWPNKKLHENQIYSDSILYSALEMSMRFSDEMALRGVFGEDISLIDVFRMGSSRFPGQRVASASVGGNAATLLAESFLIGSSSRGRKSFLLDASDPAALSFAAFQYDMDLSVFVSQEGRNVKLYFFGKKGLPISRSVQRTLEASFHSHFQSTSSKSISTPSFLIGTDENFIAFSTQQKLFHSPIQVSVTGSAALLKRCLLALGVQIVPPSAGIPEFSISSDGFNLSVIDELGRSWKHNSLLAAYAAICFSEGENVLILPHGFSFCCNEIASCFNGTIMNIEGKQNPSFSQIASYHWSRNASLLCIKILTSLNSESGPISVADFMESLPRSFSKKAYLETKNSEISVLRKLTEKEDTVIQKGINLSKKNGTVKINRAERNRIRLIVESSNAEYAAELCEAYIQKLKSFDAELQS